MNIRALSRSRILFLPGAVAVAIGLSLAIVTLGASQAGAAQSPVELHSATSFAVLAGSTVTNTGPSVINGDLGVDPGSAITGFKPPATEPGTINGVRHAADAVALTAQGDDNAAYTDAAGRNPVTNVATELGGKTLVGGVYVSGTLGLTGTLTLNGDASSVWIFKAASTLITAPASQIVMTGGANACNVFWQIGSSATLATASNFVGTVLASTSITAQTGANIQGRLFAQTGEVSLDTNVITAPTCDVITPPTTSAPGGGTTSGPGGGSGTRGGGPVGGGTGTGTPGNGRATGTGALVSRSPSGSGSPSTPGGGAVTENNTGKPNTPLAETGANVKAPLIAGLMAVLFGTMLIYAARRTIVTAKHRR